MRLSIKPHNRAYINNLAKFLNCPPSEALNYLLLKIKSEGLPKEPITEDKFQKIGFDFNEDILISLDDGDLDALKTPSEKMDDFYSSQSQSQSNLQEQIDPLIARLLSAGLEGF
jgi:hypothetical protein